MKKFYVIALLFVSILFSCNTSETKRQVGEPYIEIEGTEANGIHRKYNAQGIIESEIPYKDSLPHGIQKTYYNTGKLFRETPVEMGVINGTVKEYYASGALYREMPTIKGRAEGIVKKYYEDGKLMAEIPYQKGKQLPGIVEYDKKGDKIQLPKIILKPINNTRRDGNFLLELTLSDKYITPEYSQIVMFEKREVASVLPIENGKGIYKIYIPKGAEVNKTLVFEAKYTSLRNNQVILRTTYKLETSNEY